MSAKLYALDFDGVICDSAIETAVTGWKVACQLWTDMPQEATSELVDAFRQVRPVMETGYESVLIMRALFEGLSADILLKQFKSQLNHLIRRDLIDIDKLKQRFGQYRDDWIKNDLDGWIAMNPLFDGIKNKLQRINVNDAYIITTKQERFVSQIFACNEIGFPEERIYGLDRQLSKEQVLSHLLLQHPEHEILFVEDRLPTLLRIIDEQRFSAVKLFFADWGYSTDEDKAAAQDQAAIKPLNLTQFSDL